MIFGNKIADLFSDDSDSLIGRNGLPWKPTRRSPVMSNDLALHGISQWDPEHLPALAQQLLATANDLDLERRDRLAKFFDLSVNYLPDKRSSKLKILIGLLCLRRSVAYIWSIEVTSLMCPSTPVLTPIRNDELEEQHDDFMVCGHRDLP